MRRTVSGPNRHGMVRDSVSGPNRHATTGRTVSGPNRHGIMRQRERTQPPRDKHTSCGNGDSAAGHMALHTSKAGANPSEPGAATAATLLPGNDPNFVDGPV